MIEEYVDLYKNLVLIDLISTLNMLVCTLVTLFAIYIEFAKYHRTQEVKQYKKSFVETGSMFLFFFGYYVILKFHIGAIKVDNTPEIVLLKITGNMLVALFCFIGIKGRFDLKDRWANQVTIYTNHKIVSTGMYRYFRHPLYASFVWMFTGACFVYMNYIALLLVWLIFVPLMFYRAKQEEELLMKELEAYKEYKSRTGMFFPKLIKR